MLKRISHWKEFFDIDDYPNCHLKENESWNVEQRKPAVILNIIWILLDECSTSIDPKLRYVSFVCKTKFMRIFLRRTCQSILDVASSYSGFCSSILKNLSTLEPRNVLQDHTLGTELVLEFFGKYGFLLSVRLPFFAPFLSFDIVLVQACLCGGFPFCCQTRFHDFDNFRINFDDFFGMLFDCYFQDDHLFILWFLLSYPPTSQLITTLQNIVNKYLQKYVSHWNHRLTRLSMIQRSENCGVCNA